MAWSRWAFGIVFAFAVALAIAPLWVCERPPLVDLPQHAGQLAIAAHWEEKPWLQQVYEPNPWANQLVVPALVSALGSRLSVLDALRVVLSLAILAYLASVLLWIRDAGGNRWSVLLVLPTVYGFALRWGFLSFFVAVPLSLVLLLGLRRFAEHPSRRLWLALAAGVVALFFTHVLMLVWFVAVGAAMAVTVRVTPRVRLGMVVALAVAAPLVVVWWFGGGSPESLPKVSSSLFTFGSDRIVTAASAIVGWPAHRVAALAGLVTVVAPWLIGARPLRELWRWTPLGVSLLALAVVPLEALGTALLYPRYALLVVPSLLIALSAARPRRLLLSAAVLAAVGWQVVVVGTFRRFEAESSDARTVVDSIPSGARVLGLIERPTSDVLPWYPYVHFVQWYQAEGKGVVDFSFSDFFPSRYRYRPPARSGLPAQIEWRPEAWRWSRHRGELYDVVVLRRRHAAESPAPAPGQAGDRLELAVRANDWELWRRAGALEVVAPAGDEASAAVAGDVTPGPLDQHQ